MSKSPINEKVNLLSAEKRQKLIDGAVAGESITEMSKRLGVEFSVAQRLLWQSGTLPWQGSKTIITRRLRSLRTACRRSDRNKLAKDVEEQVAYLYYAAKRQQDHLPKVKNLLASSADQIPKSNI